MIDLRTAFHDVSMRRKMYFDQFMENTDLNLMEIEIIVSLYKKPENNTFTEIMKSKGYAKSYVSKAITNLVNEGYLRKQGLENNKKVYQLFLLDKSEDIVKKYESCIEEFQKDAFVDISEKDLEIFQQVIKKIAENLEEK